MRMRTMSVVGAVVALSGVGPALAGDDFPPPWRGTPGSTFQKWQFLPGTDPTRPEMVANPAGQPFLQPGPGTVYLEIAPGTNPSTGPDGLGVWCIDPGGVLLFTIPNFMDLTMEKQIYIQYKYFSPGAEPQFMILDAAGGMIPTTQPFVCTPSPGHIPGQSYSCKDYLLPFCPGLEVIKVTNPDPVNPLYLDQIVIDTRCIPAPGVGSAMLLAAAGLVVRKRT